MNREKFGDLVLGIGIGIVIGMTLALALVAFIDPLKIGAKKHYKGEIACETLKNNEIVCYEVKL